MRLIVEATSLSGRGASKSGESAVPEQPVPAGQVTWWRFVESVKTRAWKAYRPDT